MADVIAEFKNWVTSDKKVSEYWSKVNNGTATWKDAEKYSELVGNKLAELLDTDYANSLDDETLTEIIKGLKKAYSESAYYSKGVQGNVNQRNRISMRPLEPHIDDGRIENLVKKVDDGAEWALDADVIQNITRSAVNDTMNANARIQEEAGLHAYLKRTGAGCCAWCDSMCGTYEFGKQPADFWKVHKNCTCEIEYVPSKNKISRIRYESGRKITQ